MQTVAHEDSLLLTYAEAARLLGLSVSMVRKMARTGRIEVVHIGRCARIPRAALMELAQPTEPEKRKPK